MTCLLAMYLNSARLVSRLPVIGHAFVLLSLGLSPLLVRKAKVTRA